MKVFSQDLFMSLQHTDAIMVTISVVKKKYVGANLEPAPTAVVVLTADGYSQVNDTITVPAGTKVHCKTTLTDYNDDEQDIVAYDNTTVEVKLNNRTEYLFTLTLTPSVPFTLVCLDENDVPTGRTSSTGSMYVPNNYKVRADLQNPDQFTVNASDYIWTVTDTTTVNRTLKALVSFGTLIPSDAQHEFSIEDNQFTTPDYNNTVTTNCTNTVYWRVSKPGFVTQSSEVTRSGSPVAYFTNQTLSTITLSPEQRHFTVTCTSPVDATVTVTVNGIAYTDTGTVTADCIIGDTITWSIQRNAYESKSGGPITMSTEDLSVSTHLDALYCYVTVTSTPPQATVQILRGDDVIATGTGSATATCIQGEQIRYKATYDDQTQEMIVTVPEETSHTYTLTLSGMAGTAMIITSTGLQHLVAGQYKYIAISGGGAGSIGYHNTRRSGRAGSTTVSWNDGPSGGSGGGAGNIAVGTFVVSTEQDVYINVGAGGVEGTNSGQGGTTSLTMGNSTIFSVAGGTGGSVTNNGTGTGGSGTSGGGAGGKGMYLFVGNTTNSTVGTAGANGGLGGGNGAATDANFTAGTGVLDAVISYENNAGAYVADSSSASIDAGRGGGGRGLVSIQSAITPTFVNNLNASNMNQLYNTMGGGGSGGGAYAENALSTVYRYGPPGGGGGSWTAGSIGVSPVWTTGSSSAGAGGEGGSGAVILCRISWS